MHCRIHQFLGNAFTRFFVYDFCFFLCRMFWTRHRAVGTSSYDSSLGTTTIGSSCCSYLLLFFYQKRYDILHALIFFSLTHLTPTTLSLPLPPFLTLSLSPPSITRSPSLSHCLPPSLDPSLSLSLPPSTHPFLPPSLSVTVVSLEQLRRESK